MAQIGAAVRAFVAVDPSPEAVMAKLDLMFGTYGMSQLVTLVYLVVDTARDQLTFVNAGHPPPVVLRADGSVEHFPSTQEAPLGVAIGPRHPRTVEVRPGDAVMAFTDGLIERRGEDIDEGQRRLADAVPELARGGPLGEALHRVVEQVRDHTREDDVAALVARRHRRPAPSV
jgi:serine phosphatase RsbU (regulator of sigma subunit)